MAEKGRTAEQINADVHTAIGAYIEKYGPEVQLNALRPFVREEAGVDYASSTLARMLAGRGYVKEGVRKIDTCPGKATFYVPAAKLEGVK